MDINYIKINNSRIAYFLKSIDTIYFDGTKGLIIPYRGVILEGAMGCSYHIDLSWIMDAVNKIITESDIEFKITAKSGLFICHFTKLRFIDIMNYSENLVESIYKSVVDYLDYLDDKEKL